MYLWKIIDKSLKTYLVVNSIKITHNIYICSPTPIGLSSLVNEVIVMPLAYMQGSSYESSSQ